MDPSILFSLEPNRRQRRINEIRRNIRSAAGSATWSEVRAAAKSERDLPPYRVGSLFPGRDAYSAELMGMDWTLCRGIGDRILRHALMYLMDGDAGWISAAMSQAEVLFDDDAYPAWNHRALMVDPDYDVHLRTGMLAQDVGLMLNWLRPHLQPDQLATLVGGLDKRAIRPYQDAIGRKPWWIEVNNNWLTCIVGGLGICGMALDGLHPEARNLVAFADPLMERHLEDFGPDGEFNEGLGYAGAIGLVVTYFACRLGWAKDRSNRLSAAPFPEIARWYMQMTVPPGHLLGFGDGHARAPLKANWMAALAGANQDPVIQDFYLHHRTITADPVQMLFLDSDLPAASAQGHLPLGVAYQAHGANIVSRTSWDWDRTASVVGSKARREDNHEHNDPGQVVIDGEGLPLIVDWGTPPTTYPAGFFTKDRFRYFDTQAFGHNIPVFGQRDMKSCYVLHPNYTEGPLHGKRALRAQGHIVSSTFDPAWGGLWTIDTTAAWDGVRSCRRTVLHGFPGFVVVLDQAQLEKPESISLRWNTALVPTEVGDDGFSLQHETVGLAARVIDLDANSPVHRIANQRYHAPWNQDQFGNTLPDRACPYYEMLTTGDRCHFLSLFSVQTGNRTMPWVEEDGAYVGTIGDQRLIVTPGASGVTVHSPTHNRDWTLG